MKKKRIIALLLVLAMMLSISPMRTSAATTSYGPSSWGGSIYWEGHSSTLAGHYVVNFTNSSSGVHEYTHGLICIDPSKGADVADHGYGNKGSESGSNKDFSRIVYLAKKHVADSGNNMNAGIAAWAVATGLVYDVVEGRVPAGGSDDPNASWGKFNGKSSTNDAGISYSYYTNANDAIIENLRNYAVIPSSLYKTAADAEAHVYEMEKQADGSFKLTLPAGTNDAFWTTDKEYYGFRELEGTSGTLTVNGASMGWTRNGSVVTFTISAAEAAKWSGGYSGAVKLNKRLGGYSDSYTVLLPGQTYDQPMIDTDTVDAAPAPGYLAFHAQAAPAKVYFTKSIASDKALTDLCPGSYSLDGTQITVYMSDQVTVAKDVNGNPAVLTIASGKTPTIELEPGSYYYKETKTASAAFDLDSTVYGPVPFESGQTYFYDIANTPNFDPIKFVLIKEGLVNGEVKRLPGAQFTLYYFTTQDMSLATAKSQTASAAKKWVFETDANGIVTYDDSHKVSGDALFKTSAGEYVGLPGSYLFVETKTPDGFLPCDDFIHYVHVNDSLGVSDQINIPIVTDENETGFFYATKGVTDNEPLVNVAPSFYSLSGAEFTVYYKGTTAVAKDKSGNPIVLTTDANGKTQTVELAVGQYDIKETKAPQNFELNSTTYSFTVAKGNTSSNPATIKISDKPVFESLSVLLKKVGTKRGVKNQPLAGAEYKVSYYASLASTSGTAARTWYFTTDANGEIKYDAAHLTAGKTSDALFTTVGGKVVGLPGSYVFEEVKAPYGYEIASPVTVKIDPSKGTMGTGALYSAPTVEDLQKPGYFYATKVIAQDQSLTDIAPQYYSLDGAEITIYYRGTTTIAKDIDGNDAVIVISGGKTSTVKLPLDDYTAKETKAPVNFTIDSNAYDFTVSDANTSSNPATIGLKDAPKFDSLSLILTKIGKYNGTPDQPLATAVFKVSYYTGLFDTAAELSGNPVRTWYFETDKNGQILFDTAHFAAGYTSDELFTTDGGKVVGLPGSYSICEERAPVGYVKSDNVYVVKIDPATSGFGTSTSVFAPLTITDEPQTIYLRIIKVDPETGLPVAPKYGSFEGARFNVLGFNPITAQFVILDTITTDADGLASFVVPNPVADGITYTSYFVEEIEASPGCIKNPNRFAVTPGLSEINVPEIYYDLDVEEGHTLVMLRKLGLDDDGNISGLAGATLALYKDDGTTDGIFIEEWTTDGTDKVFDGLPVGDYFVREFDEPGGFFALDAAVPFTVEETESIQLTELYNERIPEVDTKALSGDGLKMIMAGPNQTIVDTVSLSYLTEGIVYEIQSELVLKDDTSVVVASDALTITAAEAFEDHDVTFTIDATAYEGKDLVIFTDVYQRVQDPTDPVVEMHDPDDEDETIHVPGLATQATDAFDDDKTIVGEGKQTITDKVDVTNIIPGETYTVTGFIVNGNTGDAILDGSGAPYTGETTFTATDVNETVYVTIEVNGEDLPSRTVVYEDLYIGDVQLGEHHDKNDEDQALYTPFISTVAFDTISEEKVVVLDDTVEITDRVDYLRLMPETEYRLEASLADFFDGSDFTSEGVLVTGTATFTTPSSSDGRAVVDGSAYVTFSFKREAIEGRIIDVYEKLYKVETDNLEAYHTSYNDIAQAVFVPDISTTAVDSETGVHVSNPDEEVTIKDTIKYTNLFNVPTYHIVGKLVNAETHETLFDEYGDPIISELDFTPDMLSGNVEMYFTFDGSDLAGETVLVYEYIYLQDTDPYDGIDAPLVAKHVEDDAAQMIYFPEIGTELIDKNTGLHVAVAGETVLDDAVEYTNVEPGVEMTIKGELFLQEEDENGELVITPTGYTAETTLIPNEANGVAHVEFEVDLTEYAGKKIYAAEYLFINDVQVAEHNDSSDDKQVVVIPEIGTLLEDSNTETNLTEAAASAKLIDHVEYTNLIPGVEYVMSGELFVRDGSETGFATGVVASTTFTPDEPDGTVDVVFEFDGRLFGGRILNAQEDLFLASPKVKLTEHRDVNEEGQSTYLPVIATSANDSETAIGIAVADEDATITDTVSMQNLYVGEGYTYRVEGYLVEAETGEKVYDSDGYSYKGSTTFTPDKKDLDVDVTFVIDDATRFKGKSITVYEILYLVTEYGPDKEIARHCDAFDELQTVRFPEIGTELTDAESGLHVVREQEEITLNDLVKYTGLVANEEFTISGELMLRDTNEDGSFKAVSTGITAETTFVPKTSSGEEVLPFTFKIEDYSKIRGEAVVAFETLKYKDVILDVEADISDEAQTVYIPTVTTTMENGKSDGKNVFAEKESELVDTVVFRGLLPGLKYDAKAVVMDAETGKPVKVDGKEVFSTATFTTQESDGSYDVSISINTKELLGKRLVCFEELYLDGYLIAEHKDIESPDQSVYVPLIKTMAKTGNGQNFDVNATAITVSDTIMYKALEPTKTYVAEAVFMDRDTKQPLAHEVMIKQEDGTEKAEMVPYTAITRFTPENADGEVSVSCNLQISEDVKKIVVFETVYEVFKDEDGNEVLVVVGEHKDLSSKDQTLSRSLPTGDIVKMAVAGGVFVLALAGLLIFFVEDRKKKAVENIYRNLTRL